MHNKDRFEEDDRELPCDYQGCGGTICDFCQVCHSCEERQELENKNV